ncbi:MAG: 30S ribosomal protein S20 [Candidatus Obscuribacterales bacterium]|nr:30S ribosomal protein S20 [Candidatus Obscuribacterales bacterium]
MPNIKSAKKRVLTAERNRVRNRIWKSKIRTEQSRLEEAIKTGNAEGVDDTLSKYFVVIDKAVSKGVLHNNTGARNKSRLTKRIKLLKAGS